MKHNHQVLCCAVVAMILAMASIATAVAPHYIDYQGRATDASGNPVADGSHTVKFEIVDKLNNNWWNEQTSVTTSAGLFTHQLGKVTPLNMTLFNERDSLFLQVTFDGQVLLPRTMFTSVPYALHVNSIDNSGGGVIHEYIAIHSAVADDEVAGIAVNPSGDPNLWMKGASHEIRLDAGTGSMYMTDTSSVPPIMVSSIGIDMKGRLYIGGANSVLINSKATGQSSVILPDDAIESREIVDEPGIACASHSGTVAFTTQAGTDVVTVSMTIPSSGYIVLEAKFWCVSTGVSTSYGWIQIDETAGGSRTAPYFSRFGQDTVFVGDAPASVPGYVSRVYYKSAGTYTFRLEGGGIMGNVGALPQVNDAILLATYYPTSYGSVTTLVSGAESGQFDSAKPLQVDGQTMYEVDLRDLELRAAKAEATAERARADAEKAQSELLRARYQSAKSDKK